MCWLSKVEANFTSTTLVLGQVAGAYREQAPLSSLRPHFACTWFNRIPPGQARTAAIVPDGCIDLQWINGVLRVAGPDREVKIECIPAGATVIGLRFQPGSVTAWLRVPASEIVNERLPLEAFWGSEARNVADWVSEARTPESIAQRLEAAIARKAATIADPPNGVSCSVFHLVKATRWSGTEIVRQLSDRLGLSERTLRRRCHEAFGYGPKTLDRILRFQRFLHLARLSSSVSLAGLAAEAGYSDQAHLTRETRRLAGLTPSVIVAQLTG